MKAAYILQGLAYLLLLILGGILFYRSAYAPASPTDTAMGTREPLRAITSSRSVPMNQFTLTSPAFTDGDRIPSAYTCDGNDKNPALIISGVPEGTVSLALVMDDPDSPTGTWDHWVVFNVLPSTTHIDVGVDPGGISGKNTWGKNGYGGPCPGKGEHQYHFKVYALDIMLDLSEGATKAEIETAMEGHVLGLTQLIGRYERIHK